MKMKRILPLLIFVLITSALRAQEYNPSLLKRYTAQELSQMQQNDPKQFEFVNYAVTNAIYFIDYPSEKAVELTSINLNEENATIYDLGLNITDQNQYFRINGSNKVMVVKSMWVLNHELNNNTAK